MTQNQRLLVFKSWATSRRLVEVLD